METFYQYLILRRIRKILKNKKLATYKLSKDILISKLNDFFWDKAGKEHGFWNKKIYKKFIEFLNDTKKKHKNKIGINYRTTYSANLDSRSDELVTYLIGQEILKSDNEIPANYYVYRFSISNFLSVFKWLILVIMISGVIIPIVVNLISNYLWDIVK